MVVAQVVNGIGDATKWAELFAGIGSWSWVARRMAMEVGIAVECNDDVSEAYRRNHPEVPCFTAELLNFEWVPPVSVPLKA